MLSAMTPRRLWTREETLIAFRLYSQIPFGSIDEANPRIQQLAELLGRNVGAVSLKLANLARLDPVQQARGIRGMAHGAKLEAALWTEFLAEPEPLIYEAERAYAARMQQSVEAVAEIATEDLPPEGREREAVVRVRVNQSYFRRRVLSAYDFRCCVTGLDVRDLLVASHIVAWAEDRQERLNPRNGLCLNALHDRAFDRGLMWVEADQTVHFSARLRPGLPLAKPTCDWLLSFAGQPLRLPPSFSPDPAFLERHAKRWRGR